MGCLTPPQKKLVPSPKNGPKLFLLFKKGGGPDQQIIYLNHSNFWGLIFDTLNTRSENSRVFVFFFLVNSLRCIISLGDVCCEFPPPPYSTSNFSRGFGRHPDIVTSGSGRFDVVRIWRVVYVFHGRKEAPSKSVKRTHEVFSM